MFLPFFFFFLLPCVWQGHFFFRAFLKGIQCWIEMYVFMEVLVTYKNALILSTQLEGFFLVDCLHSYDNYPIYTQDISTVGQSPRGSKCHQRATPHQEQGCLGSIIHFFHFSLARRYYTILGHFLKTQYSISEIHHNSVCTGR